MKPAQIGLGGGPAIAVFVQPRDGAVVHHFALLVTPTAINHLSLGHLVDVARNDAVHQLGGIASGDEVLVQRSDVNQRRRIANRVVLVLVMDPVNADRVVSRPLAVVEALAEGESAFVECGSNGHDDSFCVTASLLIASSIPRGTPVLPRRHNSYNLRDRQTDSLRLCSSGRTCSPGRNSFRVRRGKHHTAKTSES